MKYCNHQYWNKAALLFVATVVITLTACGPVSEKKGSIETPNFILIYTDEMQFSDLGCCGGDIPTPNID